MNKKIIIAALIVLAIAGAALIATSKTKNKQQPTTNNQNKNTAEENKNAPVKEFSMQSFVEFVGEQPKPQFSLKEITVKKGDLVRLKITVTKGSHDFKIDEFNVYADTKLNEETTVEFIADKAGEFTYYCAKPGHRAAGHWGTLKVLE